MSLEKDDTTRQCRRKEKSGFGGSFSGFLKDVDTKSLVQETLKRNEKQLLSNANLCEKLLRRREYFK
jgi:hypothetical protein